MRISALALGIALLSLVPKSYAQESTRDDFKEFCQIIQGRWIGDITWAADWPGMGKRGERVKAYWDGTFIEDGHAFVGKFYGGSGSSTSLITYDAGSKQIQSLWITSSGTLERSVIYKRDGKWTQRTTGTTADGAKTEDLSTLTVDENGTKCTWRGCPTIGGKKGDEYTDVWRRLSK